MQVKKDPKLRLLGLPGELFLIKYPIEGYSLRLRVVVLYVSGGCFYPNE